MRRRPWSKDFAGGVLGLAGVGAALLALFPDLSTRTKVIGCLVIGAVALVAVVVQSAVTPPSPQRQSEFVHGDIRDSRIEDVTTDSDTFAGGSVTKSTIRRIRQTPPRPRASRGRRD